MKMEVPTIHQNDMYYCAGCGVQVGDSSWDLDRHDILTCIRNIREELETAGGSGVVRLTGYPYRLPISKEEK